MIQLQNKRKRCFRPFLVAGIAVTLAGIPITLRAQDRGAAQNPAPAAGASPSAGANVSANASANISQDDSRSLDQFLGSHEEIARQLQSNPALVNDPDYLRANPELRDYLQQHPQLETAFRDNAAGLLRRQQQFNAQNQDNQNNASRDNFDQDQNRGQNNQAQNNQNADNPDRDAELARRNQESARIDQFLQDHPNIDKDLRSKPANVNDDGYLKKHAELANFLRDNPDVRDQCQRNPAYFEDRDLRAQMIRTDFDANFARDNGLRSDAPQNGRTVELNEFDRFLDSHPEIAEQLRKDPSLADNQKFVQDHPALQTYLQQNPAIRDQLSRDPNAFMHQEDALNRFDDRDRDRYASFWQFMNDHPRIREDVSKDPTVVRDHNYLNRNPELGDFLNQHPDVRDAWSADPQSFVKSAQQTNPSGTTGPSGAPSTGSPTSPAHTGTDGTGSSPMGTGMGSGSSSKPDSTGTPAMPTQPKQ